jgi:hypothetical protein
MNRITPKEAIFTSQFERARDAAVRPGESVLGDYIYWWGFKDVDYHWNSWIWNWRWRTGASFDEAFNRLCPDVVVYDDTWRNRYPGAVEFAKRFPSMAPRDPAEQQALEALLARQYTRVQNVTIEGRRIEFWRRKAGACRGILTGGRGDA